MKKSYVMLLVLCVLVCTCIQAEAEDVEGKTSNRDRIRPYSENPRYWQYRGEPVLLLGGSKDDNLFQIPDLKEHLDLLASVGGNYIRNTMSARIDKGFEVQAFKRLPDGKYDLNQWNDEYWKRFQNLLKWTGQHDIIVQIEVWDRFDYTDRKGTWGERPWQISPYKPANNINYTSKESGLAETYPDHPGADKQPFFHTIPAMDDNKVLRRYQEAFVDKILSYSLPCGNVLYCMNNETSTPPIWGQYWMKYIKTKAAEFGVDVYVTDMFDVGWELDTEEKFLLSFDRPDIYTFLDISQNTGNKNTFKKHWQNILFVRDRIKNNPRPINNTKNYGSSKWPPNSNYYKRTWRRWTTESAVQRYVLNVIGGCASTRFHRNPIGGIGLTKPAQDCIKALRKLESLVKMWELAPRNDLLTEYEDSKVFLSANPGRMYTLFFLEGGSANVDLRGHKGTFLAKWINVRTGQWGKEDEIEANKIVTITSPDEDIWLAAMIRKRQQVSLSGQGIFDMAKLIHEKVLTLDSHVDIPDTRYPTGAFDPGIDNPRLKCDLVKMNKGGVDGVFLAAYVRQQNRDADGYKSAYESAVHKIGAIHRLAEQMYPERCELALSPDEVERVIKAGKRAIMVGIENGFAIGKDLSKVKEFYDLGVRYITLSHNGHNDICDSCNPREKLGDKTTEHNGLSKFGEKVVAEMNRLGIMVDVSHISVESFYDVIKVSKAPVIASHSGCCGVTEHSRNLYDKQLKALAKNGGVIQIVGYSGFLKPDSPERREAIKSLGEAGNSKTKDIEWFNERMKEIDAKYPPANVTDFVDHIDHAVKVAGIDYVGIGSDFDGGGGIPGFNDHSEALNVTIELVKRGYSEEDIAKIWGTNLLRVWREVEKVAQELRKGSENG